MSSNPLWKRTFDALEMAVAPPAEAVASSEAFQQLVALRIRTRREVRDRVHGACRRVLHAWNVPAWTDVRALSEQVARVERGLRDLEKGLDDGRPQSR
jgi:hypothetical protein